MTEKVTFDFEPDELFASDKESRVIRGLAVPTGSTARNGGRDWRFEKGSVSFARESSPLLLHHDTAKPVGRLTASEWTDRGLEATFTLSKTRAADEALELAADGVVGFSIGIEVPEGGAEQKGSEFCVSKASAYETSLVSIPAFAESTIDSVAFNAALDEEKSPLETANLSAPQDGPVTQPVPRVSVVREEAVTFSLADAYAGFRGDAEAAARTEQALTQRFAVATTDTDELSPAGFRPDLYVDTRMPRRPLGSLVSHETITDINPFVVPMFNTAANLIAAHVEGTEPALGSFTLTDQTLTPAALSGKIEINREVIDRNGPATTRLIWAKMVQAAADAAEARLAALLAAFVDAQGNLAFNGVDKLLAADVDTTLIGVSDVERYNVLAAEPDLFAALYTARDDDGRKLYPAFNASNADGTTRGFRQLDMGNGLTAVQVPSLTDSYLIESGSVYQWMNAPRRLDFDIQVKSAYVGLFQYSAEAIVDVAGVRKVTYAV